MLEPARAILDIALACTAHEGHLQWMMKWGCQQKRKDLSLLDGHVILLEFMEETPLLLARPGTLHTSL